MLFLMSIMMTMISLLFTSLSHPISMGLVLIFNTMVLSFFTGYISGLYWFSYMLFLVFLGGVLVLFIYMTSLVSNEKFSFTNQFYLWFIVLMFALGALMLMMGVDLGQGMGISVNFHGNGALGLIKLYDLYSYLVTMTLILYLLYALYVCANVVGSGAGSLRKFN